MSFFFSLLYVSRQASSKLKVVFFPINWKVILQFGKVFYKPYVKSCMAQETSYSIEISCWWQFLNYFHFCFIHLQSFAQDPMSYHNSFCYNEVTFFLIPYQVCTFTSFKILSKVSRHWSKVFPNTEKSSIKFPSHPSFISKKMNIMHL